MVYVYRIGQFTLMSASSTLVVIDEGDMSAYDGQPLVVGALGVVKRKSPTPRRKTRKKTHAGKTARGRKPVGDCQKCGRVFFVSQGMERHKHFCKGTKGEK